jgi:hypothetical protein
MVSMLGFLKGTAQKLLYQIQAEILRLGDKAKHELTMVQAKSDPTIGRLLYPIQAVLGRGKICCIKYKQKY